MPIPFMAIAAGASALHGLGKAAGWWGKPPKRKRSKEELGYVEELKRRTREGVLSPETQQQILGGATTRGEEVGARLKGGIAGQLVSQGLERSIIGAQATRDIDLSLLRETAQMAKDLALRNERSKIQAADVLGQYGQQKTMQEYQDVIERYTARQAGIGQMLGGVGGIASGLQESKMGETAYQQALLGVQKGKLDIKQYEAFLGWLESYQGGTTNFDAMSFNEAFAEATRQGLKEFQWRGKPYTTERAGG